MIPSTSLNPIVSRALEDAARVLKSGHRVLLTTHVNPDGDAVGSTLALSLALRACGTEVEHVLADPPPRYCRRLPGIETIQVGMPAHAPDLAVVCDAAGLDRIGPVEAAVKAAKLTLEIDHHSISRPFGHIRVVDDTCFATAELIYHLLREMDAAITPAIATCLMMGVVTDTGAYRFTNTNAHAFELSARLVEAGADLAGIMNEVYDQKSLPSLQILERALSHLRCENTYASATLSLADFEQTGATQEDSEGIVGHLRSLEGVQVAALLRAAEPAVTRVSLRGRPGVNVARIAAGFGGGGHAAAAGCTIELPLDQAEDVLRQAVYAALRNPQPA